MVVIWDSLNNQVKHTDHHILDIHLMKRKEEENRYEREGARERDNIIGRKVVGETTHDEVGES